MFFWSRYPWTAVCCGKKAQVLDRGEVMPTWSWGAWSGRAGALLSLIAQVKTLARYKFLRSQIQGALYSSDSQLLENCCQPLRTCCLKVWCLPARLQSRHKLQSLSQLLLLLAWLYQTKQSVASDEEGDEGCGLCQSSPVDSDLLPSKYSKSCHGI